MSLTGMHVKCRELPASNTAHDQSQSGQVCTCSTQRQAGDLSVSIHTMTATAVRHNTSQAEHKDCMEKLGKPLKQHQAFTC